MQHHHSSIFRSACTSSFRTLFYIHYFQTLNFVPPSSFFSLSYFYYFFALYQLPLAISFLLMIGLPGYFQLINYPFTLYLFIFDVFIQFMAPSNCNNLENFDSLAKIKQKLIDLLKASPYQQICLHYRSISHQLIYFINYLHLFCSNSKYIEQDLKECIKTVLIIVKSTQLQKNGHNFPLFSFVSKKFQKLIYGHFQSSEHKRIVERTIKNQQSQNYIQSRSSLSLNQHIKFLNSPKFSVFLESLKSQRHIFQNQSCICCSRVFIEGLQICNRNPRFSTLVCLDYHKEFNRITLQKYCSALCNSNGGVILIGASKQEKVIRSKGIKFTNWQQIKKCEDLINQGLANMKPGCFYSSEKVLVYPNTMFQSDNSLDQYLRICFRICIFPLENSKLCYFQAQNCQEKLIQLYKLDQNKQLIPINLWQATKENSPLYNYIHSNYKAGKKYWNSHEGIGCFKPEVNYSQTLTNRFKNEVNFMTEIKVEQSKRCQTINSQNELLVDQPSFRYQNCCLLVLPSKNYDNCMEIFRNKLVQIKECFDLCKPFTNYFNYSDPTSRSIWLITHKMHSKCLKTVIKDLQKMLILKQDAITLMPIQKTLQIQKSKMTVNRQQVLRQTFMQRYKQSYRIEQLDSKISSQKFIHYNFNDYGQSIFAYMILEKMQLRPFFVPEGKPYLKKTEPKLNA